MEKEDIVFTCSKCRQWLESPADLVGLFVECPKCSEIIKVPAQSEDPDKVNSEQELTAPPPLPEQQDGKGSTVRIELPPDLGIPPAPKKRFILRRKS
jgi:hypothetical protein